MKIVAGIFLLFVFVAMLWIGKPRKGGVQPRFMQVWIVGILYAMVALVIFVIGVSLLVLA
jgi:hypothetical protein